MNYIAEYNDYVEDQEYWVIRRDRFETLEDACSFAVDMTLRNPFTPNVWIGNEELEIYTHRIDKGVITDL
jgi:hypothetical protein